MRKLRIPAKLLDKGENTLLLTGDYNEIMPGLEAIYLLGNFGVSPDGMAITAMPETLQAGNWRKQGLTNYADSVTYYLPLEYN